MTGIILTIQSILKFWDEVTWFVKTLEGTPEEHREAIITDIQAQMNNALKTGRPE